MNLQNGNGIKRPYNTTYHKNDINLNAKPKFINEIKIIGSTAPNNKSTGTDSKKITSNYGARTENKYNSYKYVPPITNNASNIIRKSIDRASNTSRVKTGKITNNANSNVAQNQTGSIRQYYKRTIVPINNKVIDNQKKHTNKINQKNR